LFILTPVCFVTARWLVEKFAPYARGSGIPQVMAAIEMATPKNAHLIRKFLGVRIVMVKILSSVLMVFGGGVIGREGPTIQIAGSVFKKINAILPDWWPKTSRKNVIVAGAASGLAAAFNTPLGGIVFAIEELSKTHLNYFKTALFTGVIIAGFTAQGLLGPYLYLGYPNLHNLSLAVFLGLTAVALIAGYSGGLMNKAILFMLGKAAFFRQGGKQIYFVLLCALLVATAGFFFGSDALGSGKEVMQRTLFTADKYVDWYTPLLRANGLIFSFSCGAAGGIFAPALGIGASIGSVLADLFHYTDSNANLIILSGMVAFLTGVTHSPFTSAILVLEMTDRHNVIFHLILAGMLANLATNIVGRQSIYEQLKQQYVREVSQENGG
jgi:H+/Cl- antiporter ClcA